jgi:hypothetical protein
VWQAEQEVSPELIARTTPGSALLWHVAHVSPRAACSTLRSPEWQPAQLAMKDAWVVVWPATGGVVACSVWHAEQAVLPEPMARVTPESVELWHVAQVRCLFACSTLRSAE